MVLSRQSTQQHWHGYQVSYEHGSKVSNILHMIVIYIYCIVEMNTAVGVVCSLGILDDIGEPGLVDRAEGMTACNQLNHLRLVETRPTELLEKHIESAKFFRHTSSTAFGSINTAALEGH